MFYVYGCYESGLDNPIYIGKGTGMRYLSHLNKNRLFDGSYFHNKLLQMVNRGITPIWKILLDNLTEGEAFAEEMRLIAFFGRRSQQTGCLYNLTDGGEGNCGGPGNTLSREHSYDFRIAISNTQRLIAHTKAAEAAKERNSQPVKSINPINESVVKRYTSISEAAKDVGAATRTLRSRLGRRWLYNGTYWDYG